MLIIIHLKMVALENAGENPARALILLHRMLTLPAQQLWSFSTPFVSQIKQMLKTGVPRKVQGMLSDKEMFRQLIDCLVWYKQV